MCLVNGRWQQPVMLWNRPLSNQLSPNGMVVHPPYPAHHICWWNGPAPLVVKQYLCPTKFVVRKVLEILLLLQIYWAPYLAPKFACSIHPSSMSPHTFMSSNCQTKSPTSCLWPLFCLLGPHWTLHRLGKLGTYLLFQPLYLNRRVRCFHVTCHNFRQQSTVLW